MLFEMLEGMKQCLEMSGNYEQRAVARHEFDEGRSVLDTAAVSGRQPYETGLCSELYPGSEHWIILEGYDTREEAAAGHARWLALFLSDTPPAFIMDCNNSGLLDDEDLVRQFPRVVPLASE